MLSVNYFSVFSEYMTILLYICLPLIVLSAGLAIWLHYRQKKRKNIAVFSETDTDNVSLAFTDTPTQLVSLSPLAKEDKFNLVRECRKQLAKSRAKFFALKHDFNTTQNNILKSESTALTTENYNSHMENLYEKTVAYEKQIADLQSKLEVLETVFPAQDEAYFLRQALRERDEEIARLKDAVVPKDTEQQIANLKIVLEQKEFELHRITEMLNAKSVQLANTQNMLAEMKQQNRSLDSSYAASNIQLFS
jgi:hypothetical protein